MDLKKDVGEVNVKLDSVKSSVDSLKSKVDDLVRWKHMIIGGTVVLSVLIAGFWAVMWKISDYVQLKPALGATAQQSSGAAAVQPQTPAKN